MAALRALQLHQPLLRRLAGPVRCFATAPNFNYTVRACSLAPCCLPLSALPCPPVPCNTQAQSLGRSAAPPIRIPGRGSPLRRSCSRQPGRKTSLGGR